VGLSDSTLNDELNLQVGEMMLNLKDMANQGPCITPGGADNISTLNLDEVNSLLTMDRLGNCSLQPINPQGVDPKITPSNTKVSNPPFISSAPLVSPSMSHPLIQSQLAASSPNPSGGLQPAREVSSSSDLTPSCMETVPRSLPTPSSDPSEESAATPCDDIQVNPSDDIQVNPSDDTPANIDDTPTNGNIPGNSFNLVPGEVRGVLTPLPAGTPTVPVEVRGTFVPLPAGTGGTSLNISHKDTYMDTDQESTIDEDEEDAVLDSLINVTDPSPILHEVQPPLDIINPGFQVCMFDYRVLPTIGKLYRVNNNHQLIQVFYTPGHYYHANQSGMLFQKAYQPGQIYQADAQGQLHAMGWVRL
jgi:hypothetical protein